MKTLIVTMILSVTIYSHAFARSTDEWYTIDTIGQQCKTDSSTTSASVIANAQIAHQQYEAHDITDPGTGKVVETNLQLPDMESQITFYRGRERCAAALAAQKASQQNDVDRYK